MSAYTRDSLETALLTGGTTRHLCSPSQADLVGALVHQEVVEPFLELKHEAAGAGFDLRIFSGFRSFERQLSIWDRKATGELPVLDSDAKPIDIRPLSGKDLAFAILRWSALPGASRHHWGTDLDVFDENARPEGYEVDLIPEEVDSGGMFGPLHGWLDTRISASTAFGFFRPYDRDRNGIAPERWHLSCGPVAVSFQQELTVQLLRETIRHTSMELKEVVLEHLDEIHTRFVMNIGGRHP
ncbi:MAG: M15 family metallopeptidase [Gemmatimonadota bacterium]